MQSQLQFEAFVHHIQGNVHQLDILLSKVGQIYGVKLLQPVQNRGRGCSLVGQSSGVVGVHLTHVHQSMGEGVFLQLL